LRRRSWRLQIEEWMRRARRRDGLLSRLCRRLALRLGCSSGHRLFRMRRNVRALHWRRWIVWIRRRSLLLICVLQNAQQRYWRGRVAWHLLFVPDHIPGDDDSLSARIPQFLLILGYLVTLDSLLCTCVLMCFLVWLCHVLCLSPPVPSAMWRSSCDCSI
jgi:hypothetical protein